MKIQHPIDVRSYDSVRVRLCRAGRIICKLSETYDEEDGLCWDYETYRAADDASATAALNAGASCDLEGLGLELLDCGVMVKRGIYDLSGPAEALAFLIKDPFDVAEKTKSAYADEVRREREEDTGALVADGLLPKTVAGALAGEGATVCLDGRRGGILRLTLHAQTARGLDMRVPVRLAEDCLAPKDWERAIARAAAELDPWVEAHDWLDGSGCPLEEAEVSCSGLELYEDVRDFVRVRLAEIASAAGRAGAGEGA